MQRDHRIHRWWKSFLVDATLDMGNKGALHLADEFEALVLSDDARHRVIDEHQREVLRLVAAEVVEILEKDADPIQRVEGLQPIGAGIDGTTQQTKTFLAKGKRKGG